MQRQIALKIIYKTISDSSYTNLLMRSELNKLDKEIRSFVTNLVNGVLKNYDYLLYQHECLYKKTSLKNKIILSMATYEKFYLKKEEYVTGSVYPNLADNEFDKAFINAIIHKIVELKEPKELYVKYSIPSWLYDLLKKQYDSNELELIIANYHRIPTTYYHVNNNKCCIDDLKLEINKINDDFFTSNKSLIDSIEFNKGLFYIQDINAAKLVDSIPFNKDDKFLDGCSAPGSKLFNALKYIKEINAYANDINEKRVKLIKDKAILLGYNNIHYSNFDATLLDKCFDIKFDKILLDVPCSGLGVLGRRNDIKFHIKPENLDELEIIQSKILDSASKIINDNGYILYSTCTLNKKENSKQIQKFINRNDLFNLINEETIINLDGDMFYHALLKKV